MKTRLMIALALAGATSGAWASSASLIYKTLPALSAGDRTSAGLNACTKFFDDKGTPAGKWFRAIDDPAECVSGVYPLGARDYRDDIRLDVEYGPDTEPPVPLDRNGLGVLVVYDPRDQL